MRQPNIGPLRLISVASRRRSPKLSLFERFIGRLPAASRVKRAIVYSNGIQGQALACAPEDRGLEQAQDLAGFQVEVHIIRDRRVGRPGMGAHLA